MNTETQILKYIILPFVPTFFLILFLTLLTCSNGSGSNEALANAFFSVPFSSDVHYTITSEFGYRLDPLDNTPSFHSGIDIAAPEGTFILASADGVVEQTGFSDSLGNFVHIKHNFFGITYYSSYGHMLDNSIMVQKGDVVNQGQPIGVIGATGRVTGTHLHFTLMTPILSFEEKYLVNPYLVFEGKL